jgi:hypothetical protein
MPEHALLLLFHPSSSAPIPGHNSKDAYLGRNFSSASWTAAADAP